MALSFTIPGRPTQWQRTATFKGRRINPKAMVEGQKTIGWAAKAAMHGAVPMTGPLRLEVLCVYAVPASWPAWKRAAALKGQVWKTSVPDHDNLTKQIGDALNGIAFVDDAQIVRSSIAKRYGQPERTEVRLSRVDGLSEDMPQEAFQHWLSEHGSHAQMRAAGAWLAKRRTQLTTTDLFANPRNTLSGKAGR